MNFLAHIYLSGTNSSIAIGNFMADSVRGKKYKLFPREFQIGILLHRAIDSYTDAHEIFRKSTKRLHENYGHYSGVIVDIFYDHFLAKNWHEYSDTPLKIYTEDFFSQLEKNYEILPEKIKKMMPHIIAGNWLLSYASLDGIQRVLDGMNRRTKFRSQMNLATVELKEYYKEFENELKMFFAELIVFSDMRLTELEEEL